MDKKNRIKKDIKKNIFVITSLALGLILLVMCIIILTKSCSSPIMPTPSPAATALQQTQTVIPAQTSPVPGQTATAPETTPTEAAATNTPTPSQEAPMQVNSSQVVGLHIKVDTGLPIGSIGTQKFDDAFIIQDKTGINVEEIKFVVFITDYKGNSAVRYYDSMSAAVLFNSFKFDADSDPVEVEGAKELSVYINDACNARLSWAGQTASAAPRGEQAEPTILTYTTDGKVIKLTFTNLDVMDKDAIFQ